MGEQPGPEPVAEIPDQGDAYEGPDEAPPVASRRRRELVRADTAPVSCITRALEEYRAWRARRGLDADEWVERVRAGYKDLRRGR